MEEEAVKPKELPLTGLEFVITGTLEAFSREEAATRIKTRGGTFKDNVTKNTTYLVVGADPGGAKLRRAEELGAERFSEEEFLKLLEKG